MRKLPDHLDILGHDFKICEAELGTTDDTVVAGRCNTERNFIIILDAMIQEKKWSVLFHEVMEEINTALDLELKHYQLGAVAGAFYQVMKTNNLLK